MAAPGRDAFARRCNPVIPRHPAAESRAENGGDDHAALAKGYTDAEIEASPHTSPRRKTERKNHGPHRPRRRDFLRLAACWLQRSSRRLRGHAASPRAASSSSVAVMAARRAQVHTKVERGAIEVTLSTQRTSSSPCPGPIRGRGSKELSDLTCWLRHLVSRHGIKLLRDEASTIDPRSAR